MFQNAIEAGYLSGMNTEYGFGGAVDRVAGSSDFTVDDFIEAVAADATGSAKHFSIENETWQNLERELDDTDEEVMTEVEKIERFLTKEEIQNALVKLENNKEITDSEESEYYEIAKYESNITEDSARAIYRNAVKRGIEKGLLEQEIPDSLTDRASDGGEISEGSYQSEEEIDEFEPEGDVDDSFNFADEENPAQPKPQTSFDQTDLFGNKVSAKTEQVSMFGASEADLIATEKAELETAYGKKTADYISGLEKSPDKDVSKVARELTNAAKLVAAKGATAKQITEDAADALDLFTTARQQTSTVKEVLTQPRLDGATFSPEAEDFARAMEAGKFAGVFGTALSDAKTESINDKEKSRAWLRNVGLQLSETEAKITANPNILTEADFVNNPSLKHVESDNDPFTSDIKDYEEQIYKFERLIDKFLADGYWKQPRQILDATPILLRKLGFNNHRITITPKVTAKITRDHGLSANIIKQIPRQLANPVMVFDSIKKDGSKVGLTDLFDGDGQPVTIVIFPDGRIEHLTVNPISSAYGRNVLDFKR